ncbi:MAG TPA: D-cysteine desulfhydrase family protein [Vicinamibacterales bacterium]|nr:D-cysteine desulfhydrase family protein [Vicinamibacterales bacterium]
MTPAELRRAISDVPTLMLAALPTPVEPMAALSGVLGGGPKLLVKRDDTIGFAFGGNKVRKLALLGARAQVDGFDTLLTAGALQSNHARVTAATAVKLGMHAVLVVNGRRPEHPTANALLDGLLGAEVIYVDNRDGRAAAMRHVADGLSAQGRKVFEIPIGGSTPLGSLAYLHAVLELLEQIPAPDVILHATSSGGTQAGLVAACRLLGLSTRVVGIAADGPTVQIQSQVRTNVDGIAGILGLDAALVQKVTAIEIDDRFFGSGYGVPTEGSREAIELCARTEAIFLDPVYTAKAMSGLIAYVRQQKFTAKQTVLFWHTGGQVGLFA